jgi:PAS domain-containing protein
LRLYRSGRLEVLEGGLFTLMTGLVPKPACRMVEKLLRVQKVYAMGFIHKDEHQGGLIILARSDITSHIATIEQIVNLATMAIERWRAEEALREGETRYRQLISEMHDCFVLREIVCDAKGRAVDYVTLEVNRAFEALRHVERGEVVGKRGSETLPKEELAQWMAIFGPVALTGQSTLYEMYSALNQRYYEGQVYSPQKGQFALTFSDVTERKRAEAQLNDQIEELKRWHQATLGRETRILDLKREVNALLDQSGQPPRYPSAETEDP